MKAQLRILILVFVTAALAAGCRKNIVVNERQTILFEYSYVNYAWNYQHYGFFIDSEGNVLTYSNPDNWNFPDSERRISSEKLAENLSMCRNTGIKIPAEELLKYSVHINQISSTKITAIKNESEDAGSGEYLCYQFNEASGMYKGAVIRMEGDFTCENLNFFSKRVADWMKDINSNLNYN